MKKIAIIGIICGLIAAIIPPFISPGQSDSSIIKRVKTFNERVDAVKEKADKIEPVVVDNLDKLKTVDSLLSLKNDVSPKVVTRTIIKEKPVIKRVVMRVPSDTTLYYVEGQYVNRPIIKIDACNYRYGGDTFRNNMWKGRNEDGILKGLFKKKKK